MLQLGSRRTRFARSPFNGLLGGQRALVATLLGSALGLAGCNSAPSVPSGSAAITSAPAHPPQGALSVVAESPRHQWTGIAVSRTGRMFVNYPRWNEPYDNAVAEISGGAARPFPDAAWQNWDATLRTIPSNRWVCVQSVHVDAADRLWVLDSGNPKLGGVIPGAAKLLMFDLTPGDDPDPDVVVVFGPDIASLDSYLNDVRVDVARNVAYLTDSGVGGLVVVDFGHGVVRRVLDGHPSVQAEPIVPAVDGRELRFAGGPQKGQPARIHSDGIALSADGDWLYWQALTGRTLYRVPTTVLRDQRVTPGQVAAAVERVGATVVSDGMEIDAAGNVYFTALQEGAIVYRTPGGELKTLVTDPRLVWPDSLAWGSDGSLYVATSQIQRTPWFDPQGRMPADPFRVFRIAPK